MKLLTKTPVAIIIMVVVILASGMLGCRKSLLSARKTAEDYFYSGEGGDGDSIQSDLEYIGATANNLKTIALRYKDADDQLIIDLNTTRSALTSSKTISAKYEAAQKLFDAVTALHDSLDPDKMNPTDKGFRASLYDDIKSAMQRISHNGYNDAAREFNDILEHFPAKLIADIAKVEPLQLYG